jgi:hypothetical protein
MVVKRTTVSHNIRVALAPPIPRCAFDKVALDGFDTFPDFCIMCYSGQSIATTRNDVFETVVCTSHSCDFFFCDI